MPALPHEFVNVRLAPSRIHGVGVFALCPIPSGTELFANDHVPLVWIDERDLPAALGEPHARLYADFGVRRGRTIGCPINFNNLTPGWYLNQARSAEEANVRADAELRFFAICDIAEGDELTLHYPDLGDAALSRS